ncbi:PIG-L family deacetylase [uncultured Paludibaculum sp.]|uniref:PIG-L deacetylase family protein n=1 Tax=uncultured Paludibaculum sp. TaxID=1765020 RepID=UPI002AAC0919|nr:PIG-L family deacetylase [uncultured Paludibaculum sp.]
MKKRILCLHAHPDDAEILAGGTLALLAGRGHQVIIATMTAGDCGSVEYGPQEIARIRQGEAAKAAAIIGAEYYWVGFDDLAIFPDDTSRRRVTAALRRFRPDIVLTASPLDYHCDHEATSKLVTDACFGCSAPNYLTQAYDQAPALPAIPHLYYLDPAEGIDRDGNIITPKFAVNVAGVMDVKQRMLEAHESQRAWLRKQHGMDDFVETMQRWCRSRGALAGVEYAEGFRQYGGHAYPRTPLLQEMLSDLVLPVHR